MNLGQSIRIPLKDGSDCHYLPEWLSANESKELFERLLENVHWKHENIRIMGRWIPQPRLTAWYGDKDACYTYSGLKNEPLKWLPELHRIRTRLQEEFQTPFNSVLLNYYRDGSDSMGYHSDDEKELGETPVIASLSLGASRRFLIRSRTSDNDSSHRIDLDTGSLLMMSGHMQTNYKHALPKSKKVMSGRINLTYRFIVE